MSIQALYRLSGLSAIASALLSGLAVITSLVTIFIPKFPGIVLPTLLIFTDTFILFALIGFYLVQYRDIGVAGLAGFSLMVFGLMLSVRLPLPGRALGLVGLLLFAIANMRPGILPSSGMWLLFGGALVSIAAAFLGFRLVFALGLTVAAIGRGWLGAVLLFKGNMTGETAVPVT